MRSSSWALTAAVNSRHWRAAKVSAGPQGSFESRTAMSRSLALQASSAISTQLPADPLL